MYTGELLGLDYLFDQTGKVITATPDLEDEKAEVVDFGDMEEDDDQSFLEDETLLDEEDADINIPSQLSISASRSIASHGNFFLKIFFQIFLLISYCYY